MPRLDSTPSFLFPYYASPLLRFLVESAVRQSSVFEAVRVLVHFKPMKRQFRTKLNSRNHTNGKCCELKRQTLETWSLEGNNECEESAAEKRLSRERARCQELSSKGQLISRS